jgi:hypothetical protein
MTLKNDNILYHVKKLELPPKVYAVAFSNGTDNSMGVAVAYCLEDAVFEVRQKFGIAAPGWEPKGWVILDMLELKQKLFALEISTLKDDPPQEKRLTKKKEKTNNDLMLEVIENADLKLFNKIKGKLYPWEIKYIEEKLKAK